MPLDPDTMQFFEALFRSLETEMRDGFGAVNERLDRIDATLQLHGRQVAAGARSIAALTEWASKADADYTRVLAELAELKARVAKLEGK